MDKPINTRTYNSYSKTAFERELNISLFENYTLQDAVSMWSYLIKSQAILISAYNNKVLGSRIRRLDPIYFNVAYNEWLKGKK